MIAADAVENVTRLDTPMKRALRDVASLPQTDRFVENGDVRIHVRIYGSGKPLLFLHGFPDVADGWAHQILEFAKDHMVITPTLRGYPPSSVPIDVGRYSPPELASDVAAVLDTLGIEDAVLVGSDWGGVTLQIFSLFFPGRVRGLAMLNSPVLRPFMEGVATDEHQQSLSGYTIPYQRYVDGDDKNIEAVVEHIRDPHWRLAIGEYLDINTISGMLNYYKAIYPAPPYAPDDAAADQFVFAVPSLILWGLQDPYFSLNHLRGLWSWFEKSYRFVSLPEAGHWPHHDAPERVNEELRSWLAMLK